MKKSADTLAAMAVTWRQDVFSRSDCVNGINDVGRKLKTLHASAARVAKYVDKVYKIYYLKRTANKKHKKRTANKKQKK